MLIELDRFFAHRQLEAHAVGFDDDASPGDLGDDEEAGELGSDSDRLARNTGRRSRTAHNALELEPVGLGDDLVVAPLALKFELTLLEFLGVPPVSRLLSHFLAVQSSIGDLVPWSDPTKNQSLHNTT